MPENTQDPKDNDVDTQAVDEDLEGHGIEEDDETAEGDALTITGACIG